ncbi:N-acetylmuramoyl-L-alanine amidase [Mammaliicoccus sciuri]|uniref:N-acetylmuramoyl-L-alanine amidase n=1 Tax=Mammaliicoccus sciuri TaxID=1296 RepID=UPI001FB4C49D|nr:N-acetylmuramoyl-L-alanine amidase [Mammaliicoccus sciuri]MCJ0921633.1 N-acetylmuramoyl-L-alanine amidase [Mammaliicoccus sciuri]MCJ1760907.1 N-acetylmuramoyl-L-alanine amidase [Mammaliicoccus sciuri]UXU68509.1 N-acetylmuramoyl-L-alanine amidase [Mammaliicoccus sciuri]UXV28830.1 N-acetylmuramoyl-L-alanine amidase [Mammaliicoccus sciuri]
MLTAITYLTKKGWEISSDPRTYDQYPKNYGYRNYREDGINYDAYCSGYHRAFDVYSNETNQIPAVTSGTVILSEPFGNFGGTIEIRDSNGNDWIYGHMQRDTLQFSKGDKVIQGDIIGLQGNSNYDNNPMSEHLHIQLRQKGEDLSKEVTRVCSGMPIENYDISKLNQKLDQSNNKGAVKMSRKIMIVAGHGYNDPGAVGNGTNERDFIRANIVDRVANYLKQAGHTVGIYGKDQDMYQDTAYGEQVGNKTDYGLYWVKSQGYEIVVEFHLDSAAASATGGHVIIPSGLAADSIDTALQAAVKKHVGTVRGITERSDLLHCNVAKAEYINYRLVELGFITSTKDMNYIKNNLNAYTKSLAEAINGGALNTNPTTYTVVAGDTLWSISQKTGVTVATLKKLNGLTSDVIQIGQVLKLK